MPSVESNPYVPYVSDSLPRGLIEDVVDDRNKDGAIDYAIHHLIEPLPENAPREKLEEAVEYRCYKDAREL